MLSIEDETAQTELCKAMRAGDGSEVAKRASEIVVGGRPNLVRRACLECTASCSPSHAQAVIEFFVTNASASRSNEASRHALADLVATVMAGIREGYDAALPTGACRASVDAISVLPGAERTIPNLGKLPARLGPSWLGVVALARDAVRAGAEQHPLCQNERLRSLFDGRDPRCSDVDDVNSAGLKLSALWSYSRERVDDTGQAAVDKAGGPSDLNQDMVIACDALTKPEDQVTCILATK